MLSVKSARFLLPAIIMLLFLGPKVILAQPDVDAPVISAVEVVDITTTSATISWTTDMTSSGRLDFGTTINTLSSSVIDPTLVTNHSELLTGLIPNTRYFFQVQATDAYGTTVTEANQGEFYSFTTLESEEIRRAFVGEVVSRAPGSVTLQLLGSGGLRTIILPENFALNAPVERRGGAFEAGAEVVILGQLVDQDWVAQRVLVKPLQPPRPITGVITGVREGAATIMSSDGIPQTLTLPDNTNGVATGDLVTILPGISGKAKSLVKADKLRERLGQFLEDIAESEEQELENYPRAQHAGFLIEILEKHLASQMQVIDDVLEKAPEDLKDKIRRSRAEIELYSQNSQSIKAKVRAKFELAREKGGGNRKKDDHRRQGPGEVDEEKGDGQSLDSGGQGLDQESDGQGGGQDNKGRAVSQNNKRPGSGQDNAGQTRGQ